MREPTIQILKNRVSNNNSWYRNAFQYRTKAAGAKSQINSDQVIAVWSEAYAARVSPPEKKFVTVKPITLNYTQPIVLRETYKKESVYQSTKTVKLRKRGTSKPRYEYSSKLNSGKSHSITRFNETRTTSQSKWNY